MSNTPSWGFIPGPISPLAPFDSGSWREATRGYDGKGVKVAVIDSGVEGDHPAVGGVNGYVEVRSAPARPLPDPPLKGEGEFVFDPVPHEDSYGHGTACAGIIRAIAPDCEIYSVKVLGSGLFGSGSIFIAGLRWAIENGMDVCNLSLGTPKMDFYAALHELADRACFGNTILVAAANNLPPPTYPFIYSSVISVSSHSESDHPDRIYANPTPPVDFSAYGVDIRVPWLDGGEMVVTGNSFAAPHVTGIAARLLSKYPGLSLHHVKVILRGLAENVSAPPRPSPKREGR